MVKKQKQNAKLFHHLWGKQSQNSSAGPEGRKIMKFADRSQENITKFVNLVA